MMKLMGFASFDSTKVSKTCSQSGILNVNWSAPFFNILLLSLVISSNDNKFILLEDSNYLCEGIWKQREGSCGLPLKFREYLLGIFELDLKGPVEVIRQKRRKIIWSRGKSSQRCPVSMKRHRVLEEVQIQWLEKGCWWAGDYRWG